MSATPIGDHALISDCCSVALVDRAGSVEWLCWPRLDWPSTFARLLDPTAGHWSIAPLADAAVTRRYLERSMVLETTFTTATGTVVMTDALVTAPGERGHELGNRSPGLLVRRVTATSGSVELGVDLAPRPEYGLVTPVATAVAGGIRFRGGPDVLVLSSPVALAFGDGRAIGLFTLEEGQTVCFGLHHRRSDEPAPRVWGQDELNRRLDGTVAAWRSWSRLHQRYQGPWRELVHHSGCVLQALRVTRTGAIAAAATTSLPESVGGARNWDYRYAWVRDASFTLDALWVAACPDEAEAFFDYMATSASAQLQRGGELQIMFGVGGEHDLSERELPHLAGWRDSRPVRVGNGAWNQRQLDVYGELLNAAARLPDAVERTDDETKRFFVDLADAAAARWMERDQGIWEVRAEPQHFLYSKLMCWVAVDRAIALADVLGAADRTDGWKQVQEQIADAIVSRGWSETARAFAQAFDSDALDASVLMMPIVGFIDPRDPRMLATLDAIEARLTDSHGLVYRYLAPDGLQGDEGTFLLCTFWLAHARALAGEVEKATAVFERAAAYVNDVGLLAEEVDPATGELLGNFPQAFSHIGLVNAAWAISQAEEGRA
ncbi:MAG TPA: glycoside hydrolase family 15 protein [Acidimicrobiales bacterium]|jgi:GH15 family glucan-1,4-alpha-glucosidase